jgi:hypothetical protein
LASSAKTSGSGHLLWPKGCSIEDVPVDLTNAISHALKILSWHENLPSDEIPPEWMWSLDHEIEDWFIQVEYLREQKFNGGGEESYDPAVLDTNEYAARMRDD